MNNPNTYLDLYNENCNMQWTRTPKCTEEFLLPYLRGRQITRQVTCQIWTRAMVFGRNSAMAAVRELGARHTHLRCRLMFGKWWVSLSGKRGDTLTDSYPLRFPFFVVMLTISLSFMDYFFKVNKIKLLIYGFISTHKKTTFSGLYLVCEIEMWLI